MNPPFPPPFSCIGSITLQWPLKIAKTLPRCSCLLVCEVNVATKVPYCCVYLPKVKTQVESKFQSHFVQIESCVVGTELLTAEEEDDISHPRRSNLFRWTQRVSMGFFEAVKIQNPQQELQHPKEIHGWVSRKWWDFRVSFVQGNSPPIFTCSRAQGSPSNPIKSGAGFPQIRFTEILPWWSSSQQRPYWTTCWWSPNSLEDQKMWQF